MRQASNSMLWGLFCTSSWTWCIGMYLPFIMLRLWGWPGFWAFFIPNVLGCALFGFVLSRDSSRALVARLGAAMVLFSLVTVAYQCFFSGWVAQFFFVREGAMATVASTGVPLALLGISVLVVTRRDSFFLRAGALAFAAGIAAAAMSTGAVLQSESARLQLAPLSSLNWAVPTIAFGFLLCPYLDLTFHRALQRSPMPRLTFATFGVTFGLMLLAVASLYDSVSGAPHVDWSVAALWAVQLAFTVAVHLREMLAAPPAVRFAPTVVATVIGAAILLATPALTLHIGPALQDAATPLFASSTRALLPGEATYLAFLGAYGLLFPAILWLYGRGYPRATVVAVVAVGLPCYLLGAWDFLTLLMPVPVALALVLGWSTRKNWSP